MTVRRIVYFGTPEFAVPPLRALIEARRQPVLVVTQPPRTSGRGMRLGRSLVAGVAEAAGLPLAEVASVRDEAFLEQLGASQPDLAVVVAFGQIFDSRLLAIPRIGCLNVHASLLPAYRGASPIQTAIAEGETETGVSLMWMDQGLDTGPVLARKRLDIGPDETAPELSVRLARAGAELLLETLIALDAGPIPGEPQDVEKSSYARQLERDHGRVNWGLSASDLYNRWRAYQPWPGLFMEHAGERIKLERAEVAGIDCDADPGTVVDISRASLTVACNEQSALAIHAVRRAGRRTITGRDLANGLRLHPGDRLGEAPG